MTHMDVNDFVLSGFSVGSRLSSSFVLLLLSLVVLSNDAHGQTARSYISKDTVAIGERFELILALDQAPAEGVSFLPSNAQAERFGDLEIISRSDAGSIQLNGIQTDSVIYEVATFAIDTAFVPAIPVFVLAGQDTTLFSSDPFMIPVRTLVPEDASGIKDLAPLAEFPRSIWPWILLALALAAAGYYFYQRRQQPPPPEPEPVIIEPPKPKISPYDLAIKQLKQLEKTYNLKDKAHIKPYYVGLSEIMRTYLYGKLKVPALEMTTREILYHLERRITGKLIPRQVSRLTRRILDVSDLVKFADMEPPAEVGEQAMNESKTLLDIIENAMKPAPVQTQAPPSEKEQEDAPVPSTSDDARTVPSDEHTPETPAES